MVKRKRDSSPHDQARKKKKTGAKKELELASVSAANVRKHVKCVPKQGPTPSGTDQTVYTIPAIPAPNASNAEWRYLGFPKRNLKSHIPGETPTDTATRGMLAIGFEQLEGVCAPYHGKFGTTKPCPDPTDKGRRYKVEAFGSNGGVRIEGVEIVQTKAKLHGVHKALGEIVNAEPPDNKQKVGIACPTAAFAITAMNNFKGRTPLPETSMAVMWVKTFMALIRTHLQPDQQPKIGINSQIGYPYGTGFTHDDVFNKLLIKPGSFGTVGVGACLRLIIKVRSYASYLFTLLCVCAAGLRVSSMCASSFSDHH